MSTKNTERVVAPGYMITYRPDAIGDQATVHAVFESKVFEPSHFRGHDGPLTQWYVQSQNPLILDLGAHIGAASVYFAHRYPRARIVAVEPSVENYYLLQQNAVQFGERIFCMQAAVAACAGTAYLYDPGRGPWAYRTSSEPIELGQAVEAYSVSSLIPEQADPFICKMDIEGAEAQLFSYNFDWLNRFAVLIVELHDWMLPGEACSRGLLRAVSERNFDVIPFGECIWCFNNDLLFPGVTK